MDSYRINTPEGNLQPIPADVVDITAEWVTLSRYGSDDVPVLVIALRADQVTSVVNVNNDPW